MLFHGRATRDEICRWYRSAHLFVLPTLSDGFAITQIEAMANGLPVIATPNCGSVVSDGVDGFLVPSRDPESLARVIRRYLENPECLESHHRAALRKSKQFSLQRVGTALLALEKNLHS
jgi:glycosyltransferase involved in cell wall biosynthesis